MDKEQEQDRLWQIFAHTGRVQDYLRYTQAVMNKAEPQEETKDGIDGKRTDRPRTQYR